MQQLSVLNDGDIGFEPRASLKLPAIARAIGLAICSCVRFTFCKLRNAGFLHQQQPARKRNSAAEITIDYLGTRHALGVAADGRCTKVRLTFAVTIYQIGRAS